MRDGAERSGTFSSKWWEPNVREAQTRPGDTCKKNHEFLDRSVSVQNPIFRQIIIRIYLSDHEIYTKLWMRSS